jgi:hypothetical protein
MKAYKGSGGIAPLTVNLGTKQKWQVSFPRRPVHPPQGKSLGTQ